MGTQSSIDNHDLLEDLLRAAIKEWGYAAVARRLRSLEQPEHRRRSTDSTKENHAKRTKTTAHQYVEKSVEPSEKKSLLLELAKKFENGQFLPTIGDVRYFLERNSKNNRLTVSVRQRQAAIPKIVKILAEMPEENLKSILINDNYSGPSRLGPLADAIKSRGMATRSAE